MGIRFQLPEKVLRSERRSFTCIFQVVESLYIYPCIYSSLAFLYITLVPRPQHLTYVVHLTQYTLLMYTATGYIKNHQINTLTLLMHPVFPSFWLVFLFV
jgi:hypothetical protein